MAALQAFPALTQDEFSTACKALEQRSEDKLNDTKWLSVKWTGEELLIRQTRKAFCNELNPGKSEGGGGQMDEGEDIEDLVEDPGTRPEPSSVGTTEDLLVIDCSITLSPTYAVPVLWFSCRREADTMPLSLELVYQFLVPETSVTPLRGVGVMGGISMAHHPISDLPSYFLHPCNTQEALSVLSPGQPLTPEEYLILWLGLIGPAIDLHIPSKLLST